MLPAGPWRPTGYTGSLASQLEDIQRNGFIASTTTGRLTKKWPNRIKNDWRTHTDVAISDGGGLEDTHRRGHLGSRRARRHTKTWPSRMKEG